MRQVASGKVPGPCEGSQRRMPRPAKRCTFCQQGGMMSNEASPAAPVPRPVAALVLAAGASTRLGTNKLLIELAGEPLVRRAARHALDAGLGPVIVVLGHDPGPVAAALAGLPV